MSTFKGRMKELESVLVDNFSPNEHYTCFFLSHCHTDHMHGLNLLLSALHKRSNHYLYCSPISRLILLNKYDVANPNLIKELTSATVIIVPESDVSPSYKMTVTPIPAGHCPGSIMFLFESMKESVLYTGDFRIMKGDIMKFKPLHNSNQVKTIDKLYFDSTFLNESYWNFPSRSEVVSELIILIQNWLDKEPNHHVLLKTSALYGYEFIFTELARKLKCKIHVEDSVFKVFWNVPAVGCSLTKDCHVTKIHAFSMCHNKCLPCENLEDLLTIKLSAQWYMSTKTDTKPPMWKKISEQKIIVCYSTHCSCSELLDVLNYLCPKQVEACTSTVGLTEKKKKQFIQQIICSWPIQKRGRSPEVVKVSFPLEKNYKFNLKFPIKRKEKCRNLFEIPSLTKKRLICDSDSIDS